MNRLFSKNQIKYTLAAAGVILILYGACAELYNVAWGTGISIGKFSITWLVIFLAVTAASLAVTVWLAALTYRSDLRTLYVKKIIHYRARIGVLKWALIILAILFPVWFFQYTMWGLIFKGIYTRILISALTIFIVSSLLTIDPKKLIGWKQLLVTLLLTSSAFTIAVALRGVTDYPFSLGWSEGNRLWDYSTLFGHDLYDYPSGKRIPVLLDRGRLLIGGLPFIFSGITIETARLWVGLTVILPYLLVGLAAYRISSGNLRMWLMITLWIFLFLKQGPIHPPLIVAAALTILMWGKPLWLAIPIIIYAGYYAQMSRFTWLFAPGIWIGMLELAGGSLRNGKLDSRHWTRAITLGIFGVFGGYLLPKILASFNRLQTATNITDLTEQILETGVSPEFVSSAVNDQPLLWYRLLPNSTLGTGIILGLLIAIVPTLILLIWLAYTKKWKLNIWQIAAIIGPLFAFLVVGLIVSTKIGGGGDLHNMDMFLIAFAFTTLLAWNNGGGETLLHDEHLPGWAKFVMALALAIPAFSPLQEMRPLQLSDDRAMLMTLADAPDEKSLNLLPEDADVNRALEKIQDRVAMAKEEGEVLFLDQRQLLTFGYITDMPLIAEYEKKVLMNEALSSDANYFMSFYKDLENHRFSLIVSERLFRSIKDSSSGFGEENNAWTTWVVNPILCYYKEDGTMKEVDVQLLVPGTAGRDCSDRLPFNDLP